MRAALIVVGTLVAAASIAEARQPRVSDEVRQEWNWGELIYGRTYVGSLTLENKCAGAQRLLIDTAGAPELTIERFVTLPPRSALAVPYRISPRQLPGRLLNDEIRGAVVIWHSHDAGSDCPAYRVIHRVTGRARMPEFRDAAREAAAAERFAYEAVCRVWWVQGTNPAAALSKKPKAAAVQRALSTLTESGCLPTIRADVRLIHQRLLDEEARQRPDSWKWLSNPAAIDRWSMSDLIVFRRRVANQIAAR